MMTGHGNDVKADDLAGLEPKIPSYSRRAILDTPSPSNGVMEHNVMVTNLW